MAVNTIIPSIMEAEGRGSFRWKLVEMVTSTMRHKDEVTSSNKEFWVRIAKLMCSKEVLAIWKKMKKRVAQKAIAHIVNGDIPLTGADVDKNLSPLDWLMYDRFLVINCTDSSLKLFAEDITMKQQNTMIMIFHFVQKFHIEGLMHKNPAALPQAWWSLCVEYCKCGRRGSVMLLQWRWHMMKLATRSVFYAYWAKGARRQLDVQGNFKPKPIHIAIAKRYPHVVVEELCTWQQFLATDKVVLPDQLETFLKTITSYEVEKTETDEANDDDDIVLIEPETDTIDLLDDDDENALESNIEQLLHIDGDSTEMDLKVRAEVYDYAILASKEEDVRPIKIEPKLSEADCGDLSKIPDSGLDSIRVENVQSVKVIEENCIVEKAKTVDVSIGEDVVHDECEYTVIIIEDEDLKKTAEILDTKEDISKSEKKIVEIEKEVIENNANLGKEDVNEEDEEDIIMITDDNEHTNEFSEINKDSISSMISVQEEQKADEENSIASSKQIPIDANEEVNMEELKEGMKKSTVAEENINDVGFSREDTMYDNEVDLDEYQEDVEEIMDIDDVTLKSLERQHIAMKFDETHSVAAVSLDNIEEEVATLPDNLPSQKCQDSSFDFSEDVKLISDCVVEIDKLEDMQFFQNKTLNFKTTVNLKDFVYVRPTKIVENEQVLIVGSKEVNDLLVEHSAVPVSCHVQKTRSLLTNICERTRKSKRRKKRHYEPDEILRNPDFEPKLLNLPTSFYAIPDNVRLLKACIPATVDIVADFTIADNDGIIEVVDSDLVPMYSEMEEISEQILEPATKKLNKSQEPKLQVPDVTKPAHFLDRILNESAQMGEMQKQHAVSTTLNTINLSANHKNISDEEKFREPSHKETLIRKSKPICLPSISEVRKINQGIKTAQVAPIVPQNRLFVSDEEDTRIGEVLPIEYEVPTPSLPQNSLPKYEVPTPSLPQNSLAKLVLNKKGVSFISATHPVKAPVKPKPKPNSNSPWYKPRPSKFEANLSMSSLCTMLKSLEPQQEQFDGVEQKKKRYCCSLKRHNVLNEARQRLVDRKYDNKPKLIKMLNIHKHTFAECDCCCKNLYPKTVYKVRRNIDDIAANEDIVDATYREMSAFMPQEPNKDVLCEVENNLCNLTDDDRQADLKGKEEKVSADQTKQVLKPYLRVLKPSELMVQKPNKPTSMDSETQTSSDLAESVSNEDCNVDGKNKSRRDGVKARYVPRRKYRPRKKLLAEGKKIPRQRRKRAVYKVVNVSDESDESCFAVASETTAADSSSALVSIGPIANPVLKISCVLTETEQVSAANNSIPEEPVFQQPPDAEILITEVKSAEEIAPSVTSLFNDKIKPIVPNETMIPILGLPDHLVPVAQSQPENLGLGIPKIDEITKMKETNEEADASSTSTQRTQSNPMLINLIDKLGLDFTDPLLTTASLDVTGQVNYSEATSYIVCDQLNMPKQCVVINRNSHKVLHTINLPADKNWDVTDLQKKIYITEYVSLSRGDDLKVIQDQNMNSAVTNEDMNLAEKSLSNDVIIVDGDEENGSDAVNVLNGNNYAAVIDVSVLHETNRNQPVKALMESDSNFVQDTDVLEVLPKSHVQIDLSQNALSQNQQSVETNEVSEMESQVMESTKSIPQRGSSILFDLVDQLGINSETVSGFNINSTTENVNLNNVNDQVVMQFEQPVEAMKTNGNNRAMMQFEQPVAAMETIISKKPTKLQERTLRAGLQRKNRIYIKKRSLLLNKQTVKPQGNLLKQIKYVPLSNANSKIKTINSGNYLGNKLNVKRVAEDTFTIIGEDASETNSEIALKKSHLPEVTTDSLLVKRNIVRIQKTQAKAKRYDEDFVVKPGLQYRRNKTARQLRSKARINLKESSDEDDEPLINISSDVPKSTSQPLTVSDTLTIVRGSKTLILDVSDSPAKRVLNEIGYMQPSTSHVKRKYQTLNNTSNIIDLYEDSAPGSPEYLEEEYLDDNIIDLDDIQNKNNACSEGQEDGKEDSELILGI